MDFSKQEGHIWFDGQWKPWQDANVHVLTHSLHYGLGVYEGIRAYATSKGPAIFRLDDHIRRLFESSKIVQIQIPFEASEILKACREIVAKNNLNAAYVRPLVFYGSEGMGLHTKSLKPHVAVAAWTWGEYLGAGATKKGVRIKTASHTRIGRQALFSKAKICGHYVNSMLALQEAQMCGFDEALMLDGQGFVAEGSGENIFMVKDKKLITPSKDAILLGITRATVMQLYQDLGFEVIERNITREEIYTADEAFFCGTAAEITPIVNLDGRVIGTGVSGEVTQKIQQLYFQVVQGEAPQYESWLTYVK